MSPLESTNLVDRNGDFPFLNDYSKELGSRGGHVDDLHQRTSCCQDAIILYPAASHIDRTNIIPTGSVLSYLGYGTARRLFSTSVWLKSTHTIRTLVALSPCLLPVINACKYI
jgi:hypothetical protein